MSQLKRAHSSIVRSGDIVNLSSNNLIYVHSKGYSWIPRYTGSFCKCKDGRYALPLGVPATVKAVIVDQQFNKDMAAFTCAIWKPIRGSHNHPALPAELPDEDFVVVQAFLGEASSPDIH